MNKRKSRKPNGFRDKTQDKKSALGAVIRHVKTVFLRENRGIE